jgi:alpha-tubulin suppressor-like RCC1 family protein
MKNFTRSWAVFSAFSLLVACNQAPMVTPPPGGANHALGLLEVTINAVDKTAKAKFVSSDAQTRATTVVNDSLIDFTQHQVMFTDNEVTHERFVSAVFDITNRSTNAFQNLSLYALNKPSDFGGSAVKTLIDATGASITDSSTPTASSIAQSMIPTHGMSIAANGELAVNPNTANMQVFTPSEVANVTSLAAGFPNLSGTFLEYGFVGSNTTGGRAIAAGNGTVCPDSTCQGRITLAYKLPRLTPRASNPMIFVLHFAVADESITRVTQSLEEQNPAANAGVSARATAVGATEIAVLNGSGFTGANAKAFCSVLLTSTPTYLTQSSNLLTTAPSNRNAHNVPRGSSVKANFCTDMNPGTASSFTVHGSMIGNRSGSYSGGGSSTLSFVPNAVFKAGEEVSVSLTGGLTSLGSQALNPAYVFRYRTAVTPSGGTFGVKHDYPSNGNPYQITTGDLNNDGKLDAISTSEVGVSVLLGVGDGSFQTAVTYPPASGTYTVNGAYSTDVAVGDLNNDGSLDVFTCDQGPSLVSIRLGNGDGTLGAVTSYATGTGPNGITSGDVNGDGLLDLLTANTLSNNLAVFINLGAGTFAPAAFFPTSTYPYDINASDVNNDGKLDMITANLTSNNAAVLLGNGDGTFAPATYFATGTKPGAVNVIDVNNDGNLDMITENLNSISVLLGNGTGTFANAVNTATANRPLSPRSIDFNGDGKLDLVSASNLTNSLTTRLGNGDGTFGTTNSYPAGTATGDTAVGDLNGDGKLDLLASNYTSSDISVFLNDAQPSSSISSITITASQVALRESGSALLVASLTGTGAFGTGVTWNIESGGVGSLSSSTGNIVTYNAPSSSFGRLVRITATSVQDVTKSQTIFVSVNPVKASISAGRSHSLALKPDGTLLSWGSNARGELGNGTAVSQNPTPSAVVGASNIVAIATGHYYSLALKSDGTMLSWGDDQFGELGDGTVGPLNNPTPSAISGLSNIVAIAAGNSHSLALKSDGTMLSWGWNSSGQLGNSTISPNNPTPSIVIGASNIVAIAAGSYNSLALKSDGTLLSWGANSSGQLGDGTASGIRLNNPTPSAVVGASNIVAISAGTFHSLALKSDGTLLSWGDDDYGQLGDGTVGPVYNSTPSAVIGANNTVGIVAGSLHSLALKSDGTMLSWGLDDAGQLGDGTVGPNNPTPSAVSGLSNIVALAAGFNDSLVLKSDGTMLSWGDNSGGQLGYGTIGLSNPTPTSVLLGLFTIRLP